MDKVLAKQFEAFGIEQTRIVDSDTSKKSTPLYSDTIISFVRDSMETMEGREFFYFLLNLCGVFATSYVPERPHDTAFQCGMQEIGHHVQRLAQISGENYYVMAQEAMAKLLNQDAKQTE